MGDKFIVYSPFLFVIMSIYILLELWRINFYLNRWEILSLMVIPVSLALLYSWIGLYNPPIEWARVGLRFVVGSSLGISCRVVYSYSKFLREGGKHY